MNHATKELITAFLFVAAIAGFTIAEVIQFGFIGYKWGMIMIISLTIWLEVNKLKTSVDKLTKTMKEDE